MKKLNIIFCLMVANIAYAQMKLGHVKSIDAYEGGSGFSRHGFLFYGAYSHAFTPKISAKTALFLERISVSSASIPIVSIGLGIFPSYTLYYKPAMFYVDAFTGLSFLFYEHSGSLSEVPKGIREHIPSFKVGIPVGVEGGYHINSKFTIVANIGQRYYFTSYGSQRWYAMIGLRVAQKRKIKRHHHY